MFMFKKNKAQTTTLKKETTPREAGFFFASFVYIIFICTSGMRTAAPLIRRFIQQQSISIC